MDELKNQKVLVVDDEPGICEVMAFQLEHGGAEVKTAESVEEAMALFLSWKPNAIVSDVIMPGESGIDLLKKVRDVDTNVAFVLMTGYSEKESREIYRYGVDGILNKPVRGETIINELQSLLSRKEFWLEGNDPQESSLKNFLPQDTLKIEFGRGGALIGSSSVLANVGEIIRISLDHEEVVSSVCLLAEVKFVAFESTIETGVKILNISGVKKEDFAGYLLNLKSSKVFIPA